MGLRCSEDHAETIPPEGLGEKWKKMPDTLKREHILSIVSALLSMLKKDKKNGDRFKEGIRDGSALDLRIKLREESARILQDVEEIVIDD